MEFPELQAFIPSAPYVASVPVVGIFLWRVFVRVLSGMEARFVDRFGQIDRQFAQIENRFAQIDGRFEEMENRLGGRFGSLEKKVDGLANDHHRLARELSDFRGEMRGRLSTLVPQPAGEA